jgi:hypothetical protein
MKPTNQNIERQHANASMGSRPTPIAHWPEDAGQALMRGMFFLPIPPETPCTAAANPRASRLIWLVLICSHIQAAHSPYLELSI